MEKLSEKEFVELFKNNDEEALDLSLEFISEYWDLFLYFLGRHKEIKEIK